MPKYRFHVVDDARYEDKNGTILPNDDAAVAEGVKVARELKLDNELDTRDWSVEVKDGERVVANIPFDSVD